MVEDSNEVIVFDNETYASDKSNLSKRAWDQISYYKVDIANASQLRGALSRIDKIDWIVNFAAESHVDRSISSSEIFFRTNINGVINILDYLVEAPTIDFLQVSTDEVYGSIFSGSWSEDAPLLPNSPYSSSKASAELICHSYRKTFGVKVVTTRCANNFGPNQALEKLIPKVIYSINNGKPVDVYGDGLNVREWIFVKDHVACLSRILYAQTRMSFTYNIGGFAMTNLGLIELIGKLLEVKPNIQFVPDRLGHDFRYSVNDTLIKSEFEIADFGNLDSNLQHTINWYLANPEWVQQSINKVIS